MNRKHRNQSKMLLIKMSVGALTAAVIGMIVKQEVRALDEIEEKYFPEKKRKKNEDSE